MEITVNTYWCRFLDSRGRLYSSEKLVCETDQEALAKVRAFVLPNNRDSVEIWRGTRRVDTESMAAGQ